MTARRLDSDKEVRYFSFVYIRDRDGGRQNLHLHRSRELSGETLIGSRRDFNSRGKMRLFPKVFSFPGLSGSGVGGQNAVIFFLLLEVLFSG